MKKYFLTTVIMFLLILKKRGKPRIQNMFSKGLKFIPELEFFCAAPMFLSSRLHFKTP